MFIDINETFNEGGLVWTVEENKSLRSVLPPSNSTILSSGEYVKMVAVKPILFKKIGYKIGGLRFKNRKYKHFVRFDNAAGLGASTMGETFWSLPKHPKDFVNVQFLFNRRTLVRPNSNLFKFLSNFLNK